MNDPGKNRSYAKVSIDECLQMTADWYKEFGNVEFSRVDC